MVMSRHVDAGNQIKPSSLNPSFQPVFFVCLFVLFFVFFTLLLTGPEHGVVFMQSPETFILTYMRVEKSPGIQASLKGPGEASPRVWVSGAPNLVSFTEHRMLGLNWTAQATEESIYTNLFPHKYTFLDSR